MSTKLKAQSSPFRVQWELEFLVSLNENNIAQCIICEQEFKIVRKFNLSRHYTRFHEIKYVNSTKNEKLELFKNYKERLKTKNKIPIENKIEAPSTSSSLNNIDNNSRQSLKASYAVALELAKSKKSFSDGKLVKKCAQQIAEAFNDQKMIRNVNSVPLSRQTITRRCRDLNEYVRIRLRHLMENCSYFSLCLDESTDITDMSQLLIFVRVVQNDFSVNEEVISISAMTGTTKGVDVFNTLQEEMSSFISTFDKCSCITTDGAPAMTGKDNGLVGILRKHNIYCLVS